MINFRLSTELNRSISADESPQFYKGKKNRNDQMHVEIYK